MLNAKAVCCGVGGCCLIVVAVWSTCSAAGTGQEDVVRRLIPTPKQCILEPGSLPLVVDGKSTVVIGVSDHADKKETMAAKWVAREIATLSGVTPEISTDLESFGKGGSATQLVLATYQPAAKNLEPVLAILDEADRALLCDPKRCEQAYVIASRKNRFAVVGGSAQGTLYGAMTLLQLLDRQHNTLEIARVHIRDWPDFRYRAAENWTYTEGREYRGRGWCYDWGDGVENYKQRVECLFDRCLRYKINVICFSSGFGEPFSKMWNADEFPLQKELNRLADQRGVKLIIGGYGVAAGDKELLNRTSYPDGKTSTIRIQLRTTDARPSTGWTNAECDSWWDDVRVFRVEKVDK